MLASITDRQKFDSNLDWARAEYAALQQVRKDLNPNLEISLEPGPQSSLFARLLSGKAPLAFPPPLSFKNPWYDVIETEGPFHVLLGGILPVTEVNWPEYGDLYLNYLLINEFAWGVVSSNDAGRAMLDRLAALHQGLDPAGAKTAHTDIREVLQKRPEWIVKHHPWPEYRLYLGRTTRQGRREDVEGLSAANSLLDGINITITKVLADGAEQAAGKADRVAHLRDKPDHLLSPFERRALANADRMLKNLSTMDQVEYECDVWTLQRVGAAN